MYVLICVPMYVYVWVCMWACTYVYLCMSLRLYESMDSWMRTCAGAPVGFCYADRSKVLPLPAAGTAFTLSLRWP